MKTIEERLEQAIYAKNKRAQHLAKGLCATGCGRPLRTKWMCDYCSKKSAFKNNKLRNKKRLTLVSKNICSNDKCGKPLSTKWLCRYCQDICNKYAKERWNKNPEENRKKANLFNRKYRFSGLRPSVIERDKNICQICFDKSKKIVVHHIDENPKHNVIDNLVCLCRRCHMYIETFNKFKPNLRKYFYWFKD